MTTQSRDGYQIVAPDPSGTITGLRSLGYSLEAAVADLIDNSIAAGATSVWIDVAWNDGEPWMAIIDDGGGMDEAEMITAMRVAGRGPDSSRQPTDLGRFGLGLKTASFSHARQLVVTSVRDGASATTRAWDLDLVRATGEWRLLTGAPVESIDMLERATARIPGHGTVVLWRKLDRTNPVVSLEGLEDSNTARIHDPRDAESDESDFYSWLADLEPHLAMVFHRYLASRLHIFLNDTAVSAWDPFQSQYPQTRELPSERLGDPAAPVIVTGYVLPHRRYLSDEQYDVAGGPRGWLEQQGFYVYRRDRLIVTGGWLGLPSLRVEERCSLARLAVEIPAALDYEWSLDVRKSMAVPPVTLDRPLLRLARRCREEAVKTQIRRVRLATSRSSRDRLGQPWRVDVRPNSVTCTLDRDHPLIRRVRDASSDRDAVEGLLRLVENTIPVAALRMTHEPESPDPEPFEDLEATVVQEVAEQLFSALVAQGRSPVEARSQLRRVGWLRENEDFWKTDID